MAVALGALIWALPPMWAQETLPPGNTVQGPVDHTGHVESAGPAVNDRLDLNLSSRTRSIHLGADLLPDGRSVSVNVGNRERILQAGGHATPAEFAALQQVLSGGTQNLSLDRRGRAAGGSVDLSALLSGPLAGASISDLVIPSRVTAVRDFGASPVMNVAGDLTNRGTFYVVSSIIETKTATIEANNIYNRATGVLSTVLPANGLPGLTPLVSSLDLVLSATRDIVNSGVITSSGNLTLAAGSSITNQAKMSAAQNVNLMSAIGSVTNSGLIAAAAGNINIAAHMAQSIAINSAEGSLQALGGAINVRDAMFSEKGNISIIGGDWLAKEINLNAGTGDICVNVENVVGKLSTYGNYAQVGASTPELTLGDIKIGGDPTYYNDAGSISINGNIQVTERLAILASGDVSTAAGVTLIEARDGAGQGFDIHIVAGASLAGTTPTIAIATTPPVAGNATGPVTVSGASTAGGNISFGSSPTLQIRADSTTGNLNGANVTLVAYSGSGGGTITLASGSQILTSGSGSGNNGDMSVIAGATTGTSITLGFVDTNKGTGTGGNVSLLTAQPTTSDGLALVFATNGSISSGNTFAPSSSVQPTSISILSTIVAGSNILIGSGGSISTAVGFFAAGVGTGAQNGGNISLIAGSNVDLNTTIAVNTNGVGTGNAGNLLVAAGAAFNLSGVNLTITGESATGGKIEFSSTAINKITAEATGTNGNGGNVTLVAFEGSPGSETSGRVLINNTSPGVEAIGADGLGTGSRGSVTIIAGDDDSLGATSIRVDGPINAFAGSGAAGLISIGTTSPQLADGSVLIVRSSGQITSGSFDLNPLAVKDAAVNTRSLTSRGGNVTVLAGSNIDIVAVFDAIRTDISGASGGNVTLAAQTGFINLGTAKIDTRSLSSGNAGNISIAAGGDITLGAIDSRATVSTNVNGGDILIFTPGTVTLSGDINSTGRTSGGNINVVAGTDILHSGGSITADTTAGGSAGDVLLVAGASFTSTGGNLTISGQSSSGGRITVGAGAVFAISAQILASIGAGGDVRLVAFEGSTGSVPSGTVILDPLLRPIDTSGTSAAGLVLIVAGDNDSAGANSIVTGTLDTQTGSSGGGTITVGTTTPQGSVVISQATGQITSGSFNTGSVQDASISTNALVSGGASITVMAGSNVTTNGSQVNASHPLAGSGSGGAVSITAQTGSITTAQVSSSGFNGNGGSISLSAGTTITTTSIASDTSGGTGGSGGAVSLLAGGAVSTSSITTSGTGGGTRNAGNIVIATPGSISISGLVTGNGGGVTGAGGNAALVAGQDITIPNNILLGGSNGPGGHLLVASGVSFSIVGSDLSITGQSTTGGRLNMTGASDVSTVGSGSSSGGDINLVAFEGSSGSDSSGRILLPSVTISSRNLSTGSGGSVTILAGDDDAAGANSISTGQVLTHGGGVAGTGSITIGTTSPVIAGGSVIVDLSLGRITSGSFAPNAGAVQNASVSTGTILSNGSDITILAGGNVTTGGFNISASNTTAVGSGGNITVTAQLGSILVGVDDDVLSTGPAGGNVSLTAGTTVTVRDVLVTATDSNSGDINIVAGADVITRVLDASAPATPSGTAGDIVISTTAEFIPAGAVSGNSITVTASSLTNSDTFTANVISAASPTGQGLTIEGVSGQWDAQLITLTATANNLTFAGGTAQTFLGEAILNAATTLTTSVDLSSGANIQGGDNPITINACILNLNGGSITANPLRIHCPDRAGTIANSLGDVVLQSNLVFAGKDLVILSKGSVSALPSVTSINLSGTQGDGGNLSIIAGFNFTPTTGGPVGQPAPVSTTFTITGPSTEGGSVFLPRVNINTSSLNAAGLPAPGTAGNVTVIAHKGTQSSGMIAIGSITATADNTAGSVGGAVVLIGQGGVQVGTVPATKGVTPGIDTRAATGNSVTIVGAEPEILGATITDINGLLLGHGIFSAKAPVLGAGAAVQVNGAIQTTGANGRGGDISVLADSQIEITNGIAAQGSTVPNPSVSRAGGDVTLSSLNSFVSVAGGKASKLVPSGINTSGIAISSASPAGSAGFVDIQAANNVTVTGNIVALGAGNLGTGDGGNGGNLTMETTNDNVAGFFIGNIRVSGFVDVRGGNAGSAGNGGDGGAVSVSGGTVQVLSLQQSGASIDASGGTGVNAGGVGGVDIETFASQPFPSDLNLTSLKNSIVSLPGGLFTVGIKSPVNGVAGSIVSGVDVANPATVNGTGRIVDTSDVDIGAISLAVTGGFQTITEGGAPTPITVENGLGVRTLVTPGEALALFQVSRGNSQTVTLNSLGQATAGNVTALDRELAKTFTALNVPAGVTLNFSGLRPVLTLAKAAAVIGGTLNFATAGSTALLDYGKTALTVPVGGSITGTNTTTLILSGIGKSITVHGTLQVGDLALARPTKTALTFLVSQTGVLSGPPGLAIELTPLLGPSLIANFKATGTNFNSPIEFGTWEQPAIYSSLAQAAARNFGSPGTVALTFGLTGAGPSFAPIQAVVQGELTAASISIKGVTNAFKSGATSVSTSTPLLVSANTVLNAIGSVSNSKLLGSVVLASTQNLSIGNGALITGGLLASADSGSGLVNPAHITKAGSVSLTASGGTGITVGDGVSIVANGGSITAVSGTSSAVAVMNLGPNGVFQANGGNIAMLASGTVSGAGGSTFYARAVNNPAAKVPGGGIEIGSGLVASKNLSAAFKLPAGTNPTGANPLGPGVVPTNPNGVVQANNTAGAGAINLNPGPGSASTLTLSRGAMVFDAVGPGAQVQIDNAEFKTDGITPIAMFSPVAPAETSMMIDELTAATTFEDAILRMHTDEGATYRRAVPGRVELVGGTVFVQTKAGAVVKARSADLHLKRGALAAVVAEENGTVRVQSFGALGTAQLVVHGRLLILPPGTEILLTDHDPASDTITPADGIGRRQAATCKLAHGVYATLSDFSILSLISNSQYLSGLKSSALPHHRKLLSGILKTAAAIDVVSRVRGHYTARAKERKPDLHRQVEDHWAAAIDKRGGDRSDARSPLKASAI